MITVPKNSTTAFAQLINIVALVIFLAALRMPMERSSYSSPCSEFGPYCGNTVSEDSFFFFLTLFWYSDMTDRWVSQSIAVGEGLVLLAPLLNSLTSFLGRTVRIAASLIFLLLAMTANVAILAYGVHVQLEGYIMMDGYYRLILSFLLMLTSSSIRLVTWPLSSSS